MRNKINYSLLIREIYIYTILLVYLKPINVTLIGPLDFFYKVVKLLVTGLIIVSIFKRRVSFSRASYCCLLLSISWGISAYINTGGFSSNLTEIMSIIGMIILFNYYATIEGGINSIISALANISKSYIILDFITVLLGKPLFAESDGYIKYFLGSDNYSAFILIPLCGFMFMNDYIKYNYVKKNTWIISVLGLLCLAIPFSVAGMCAYGLFIILIIVREIPQIKKIISVKTIVIGFGLIIGAILIPQVRTFISTLSIAGKVGLNSREIIWPMAIDAFFQNPIMGYGVLTQTQIDNYILYGMAHTHNILLEFIMKCGIVGVSLAILWTAFIYKNSKRVRNKAMECISYCVVAYVACCMFDFYIGLIYFWLLFIVFDIYKESRCKISGKIIITDCDKEIGPSCYK